MSLGAFSAAFAASPPTFVTLVTRHHSATEATIHNLTTSVPTLNTVAPVPTATSSLDLSGVHVCVHGMCGPAGNMGGALSHYADQLSHRSHSPTPTALPATVTHPLKEHDLPPEVTARAFNAEVDEPTSTVNRGPHICVHGVCGPLHEVNSLLAHNWNHASRTTPEATATAAATVAPRGDVFDSEGNPIGMEPYHDVDNYSSYECQDEYTDDACLPDDADDHTLEATPSATAVAPSTTSAPPQNTGVGHLLPWWHKSERDSLRSAKTSGQTELLTPVGTGVTTFSTSSAPGASAHTSTHHHTNGVNTWPTY